VRRSASEEKLILAVIVVRMVAVMAGRRMEGEPLVEGH
jgi:hypothetical protein